MHLYAGSEGVREAFDKAGNILSNFRLVEEKRIAGIFISENKFPFRTWTAEHLCSKLWN